MSRAHPGWDRPYREVLTPLGHRIKCRDEDEFHRVTRWVAWLQERQAKRNHLDPFAAAMKRLETFRRTA